jgi:adenylate cyclase
VSGVRFDSPEDEWKAWMNGVHPRMRLGRRTMGLMPTGPHCRICSAPFGAPGKWIVRPLGFVPWDKNPRICNKCLSILRGIDIAGAEIEVSVLFADIRGSSDLAREMGSSEYAHLLQRFYGVATDVLTANDAILDKFIGDEVFCVFLPFMSGDDHPAQAVRAAEALFEATGNASPTDNKPWVPLGAGIDTGTAFVGLVTKGGSSEFSTIGDPVNTGAHLAAEADAGEILVSTAAAQAAGLDVAPRDRRHLSLKGHNVEAASIRGR